MSLPNAATNVASTTANKTPKFIKPYLFHGVLLNWNEDSTEAVGECPWCNRERKFYVQINTGMWQCKVCNVGSSKGGGNIYTFLRTLHQLSMDYTSATDYSTLIKERKLLSIETPKAWGACKSILTEEWLLPGYSHDGKLNQLYRYSYDPSINKKRLLATSELSHCLFGAISDTGNGVSICNARKSEVWLAEGPWDGMALWEVLRGAKRFDDQLVPTSSLDASLYADIDVMATPGCNVFNEQWSLLANGKTLVLLFDSDHPKQNKVTHKIMEAAGYGGIRSLVNKLSTSEGLPSTVNYVKWGEMGFDPSLPSGYDIRDLLTDTGRATTLSLRIPQLSDLFDKVVPIPAEMVVSGTVTKDGEVGLNCLPCNDWNELTQAWRKAMKWISGLDVTFSCMLAGIVSTMSIGDQLWFMIMGPASSGKSTLCEALAVNRKYVYPLSTLTGILSGFKTDRSGADDHSLIPKIKNKTLVIKDGDTLMKAENLGKILSQLRDLYDRATRVHYGNSIAREYVGICLTMLLCGTNSLRALDTSELGERFLKCTVMEGIDDDLEDEVLWRIVNRTGRNMGVESNGDMQTQHDPDLVQAMQLTGGYIDYLRANANLLLKKITVSDDTLRQCARLGKFVAYMRARPSTSQEEAVEREFGSRLASQLTRLAYCLAVVLNRPTIDNEVMCRVFKVAMDTAKGRTLDIARHLYISDREGLEVRALAIKNTQTEHDEKKMLRFLKRIEAVEHFNRTEAGYRGLPRWRLTDRMQKLYRHIDLMGQTYLPMLQVK